MALVRLEGVEKRGAGGAQIISDVSLTLEAGGFYFLTGVSGSGKTTLLRLITLIERPTSGRLTLFGADTAALDRNAQAALRRRIGVVFQDLWLIDALSAGDNVALPLRIAGAPEHEVRDNVAELLAWVGLSGRADQRTATLSAGERHRVAIARAIVGRPELLIADEPTGDGGDEIALLLVRTFEQINRLGTTVLIATDDTAFARQFEHQRFHLAHGMLIDAGATAAAQ
jgi:cell division transport system ATP-binding protein